VDWTKDGEYKVTITGTFEIHGVKKERTIDGLVKVKGQEITISSKFNIHIADYNIKVPSLYVKNIAEDVEVKINSVLEPYKKN
jgi:polyisoprenoid-binding protein YceI